jgi:hypothetical protein
LFISNKPNEELALKRETKPDEGLALKRENETNSRNL